MPGHEFANADISVTRKHACLRLYRSNGSFLAHPLQNVKCAEFGFAGTGKKRRETVAFDGVKIDVPWPEDILRELKSYF